MVKKYQLKSTQIEAVKYTGENYPVVKKFCPTLITNTGSSTLSLNLGDGLSGRLSIGDWITYEGIDKKGFHIYPDEVFQKLYEEVK